MGQGEGASALDTRSVLVVDDHRVFADAIALAIDAQPALRCAGTACTGEDALRAVGDECPFAALVDLGLPGMGGVETIRELRARCPSLRVIVLTASPSSRNLVAAANAGADAFLAKDRPFAEVISSILSAEHLDPADVARARQLVEGGAGGSDGPPPELTDREREVLELLAKALPAKVIARRLGISVHTCRGHVHSLLGKFGAHSQLEVVTRAARLGMVPGMYDDGDDQH